MPQETTTSDAALEVHVRMYRGMLEERYYEPSGATEKNPACQGMLGDCFLIRLVQGGAASHILIDCGMLMGSEQASDRMQEIAEDIIKTTGGTDKKPGVLDLLVITHEHWDHISGFSQARDLLLNPKRLRIENLWMAWTEKDGDPQAARLRQRFGKVGTALAALAGMVDPKSGFGMVGAGATVLAMQGFSGAMGAAAKSLLARDIMGDIKAAAVTREFLEPGEVLSTPSATSGGPALRAYVFGPPRDEGFLFKDKPSAGPAQETYLDAADLGDQILRFAMGNAQPDEKDQPFAAPYGKIKARDLARKLADNTLLTQDEAWLADHYCRSRSGSQSRRALFDRRKIDEDWLGAVGPLALKLDSDTNNTSLVLAFDLPDGTSMVFAGDAQVGNWLSWHNQIYKVDATTSYTAEQILNRTRFYKVGHHGSHNATLDEKGLAMMRRDDLVAIIPTDESVGNKQGRSGWQMPNPRVRAALLARTGGRILRNDRRYDADARAIDKDLSKDTQFLARLADERLYLEYTLLPR